MGTELIQDLIKATGLEEDLISNELDVLSQKAGLKTEDLSLEDLRMILAEYVQDVLLEAKTRFSDHQNTEQIFFEESELAEIK